MTVASEALPEGVYRESGKYWHKVKRIVRNPDGSLEYELVPRECALVNPYETDEAEIHKARESAAQRGLDFYDPREVDGQVIGWLSYGRKRSQEWPANIGSGAVRYDRVPVPAEENPDAANTPVLAGGKAKTNG